MDLETLGELREAISAASFNVSDGGASKRRSQIVRTLRFGGDSAAGFVLIAGGQQDAEVLFRLDEVSSARRSAGDSRELTLTRGGSRATETWKFESGALREVFLTWLRILTSGRALDAPGDHVSIAPNGEVAFNVEICNLRFDPFVSSRVVFDPAGRKLEIQDGREIALDWATITPSLTNPRRIDVSWGVTRRKSGATPGGGQRLAMCFATESARGSFLAYLRQGGENGDGGAQTTERLRVMCGTFNVGDAKPPKAPDDLDAWLPRGEYDVYAVGFQENSEKRRWLKVMNEHLCRKTSLARERLERRGVIDTSFFDDDDDDSYYVVAAISTLWDIHLVVYLRKDLKERLAAVAANTEATGFAHVLGNKGAAAVALRLEPGRRGGGELSVAFVTSHLAARATRVAERQSNYEEISRGLRLHGAAHPSLRSIQTLHQFDTVFWFGDLNYRVDKGAHGSEDEFACVLQYAQAGDFVRLRQWDQLERERKEHTAVFPIFHEGPVTFPPTYRVVKGHPKTYSNKKHQNPSFCDRILWKTCKGDRAAQANLATWLCDGDNDDDDNYSDRDGRVGCAFVSYEACFDKALAFSDHMPVRAAFSVATNPPPRPPHKIGALGVCWMSLEDVVFTLAPEVSPVGCETSFRYDGYAGPLSLSVKAPFLLRPGDKASYSPSQIADCAVMAPCANPTQCEAAELDAQWRLKKLKKGDADQGTRTSTRTKRGSVSSLRRTLHSGSSTFQPARSSAPPPQPERFSAEESASAVWSDATPTWIWPHYATPPLFCSVSDDEWLSRERVVIVVRRVIDGQHLGFAEIPLDRVRAKADSLDSLTRHHASDGARPGTKDPTRPNKDDEQLPPWHVAHARYDSPLWHQDAANRDSSSQFNSTNDDDGRKMLVAANQTTSKTWRTRSRFFDALIAEDGAHSVGGAGDSAVFSAPVVCCGKWVGVIAGRLRVCCVPDVSDVAPSDLVSHLALWQQLVHIDNLSAQAASASNIEKQPSATALAVRAMDKGGADRVRSYEDAGFSAPAPNMVGVPLGAMALPSAEAETAESSSTSEFERKVNSDDGQKVDGVMARNQVSPSGDQHSSVSKHHGSRVACETYRSGNEPVRMKAELETDEKLRVYGKPLMMRPDSTSIMPAPKPTETQRRISTRTLVGSANFPTKRTPLASTRLSHQISLNEENSVPPRFHSLNPKRDAKLRLEVKKFVAMYRKDNVGVENMANEEEEEEEDDDDIVDDDAVEKDMVAYDDEIIFLEGDFVVLERQGRRVPVSEWRCVDTGRLLRDEDFALHDGLPRTQSAHLAKFGGEWIDAATLQPLLKTDNFIVACGYKWMPEFFRCAETGVRLDPSCFYAHNGQPYSEAAYREMLFTCHACFEPMNMDGSDGIRALGESWHTSCYVCANARQCANRGDLPDGVGWGHDAGDGRGVMPYCESCYRKLWTRACPSCGNSVLPALDAYVDACGERWHADHFRCAATGVSLDGKAFFENDGLPYTPEAYFDNFGERCNVCGDVVHGEIVRAAGRAWHPEHFVCRLTGRKIPVDDVTGELEFFIGDDGEIYDKESYNERFAMTCFMCSELIVDDHRLIGPPSSAQEMGNDGAGRQRRETTSRDLLLVPHDAAVAYHPECLVCVVTDKLLDVKGVPCYTGGDDGLPYCESAYLEKYGRCFVTEQVFGPDDVVLFDDLGLPYSEHAYRATHTDDWCLGCAKPIVASESCVVDVRGYKWHATCAQKKRAASLRQSEVTPLVDALELAKTSARCELEQLIDSYRHEQARLLERSRRRCRARRAGLHKEKDSRSSKVIKPEPHIELALVGTVSGQSPDRHKELCVHDLLATPPPPPKRSPALDRNDNIKSPATAMAYSGSVLVPTDEHHLDELAGSDEVPSSDVKPLPKPASPQNVLKSSDEDTTQGGLMAPSKSSLKNVSAVPFMTMIDGAKAETKQSPKKCRSSFEATRLKVVAQNAKRRSTLLKDGPVLDQEPLEGEMYKKGGGSSVFGRKSWHLRFFVLTINDVLAYYRDHEAYLHGAKPLKEAAYSIRECHIGMCTFVDGGVQRRHIMITPLVAGAGNRPLELRPKSPEDFDRWFHELCGRSAK